ncbi:MAG: 30S ribosomal protein S18 [Candidatus Melainabacteria bacterium]|nr:30S ribosomal protein S18 [Candidatus Melainabacteria bacterium]
MIKRERERERNRDRDRDRERSTGFQKRKWTPVFEPGVKEIDFKDVKVIARFITERGRILPRKITGLNAQQQKKVTKAIKRARQMSLLPFISYGHN